MKSFIMLGSLVVIYGLNMKKSEYIYALPPRDSSPGGEAFVMVSNSEARSTWHEVTSQDNKPRNE